ncbi:MAG: 30S ribosomal protein S9 [Planctomycetes bacterium]|nr:30S ribosomal protein S9 [Planctomycetota bacterium]
MAEAAEFIFGTGRRKRAVARVRIRKGKGKIEVNGKEYTEFFPREDHQNTIIAPLVVANKRKDVDVYVHVAGGGISGQAGATLLGLSRALLTFAPESENALRDRGYLTRDPRKVERKKPGQPGARKRFQFSKR